MSGTSSESLNVSELTFKELLSLFSRRKWIIIFFLIFGALLGLAISIFGPAEFSTEARVQVDARTQFSSASGSGDIVSTILNKQDDLDIQTEAISLKSTNIYYGTLNRLGMPLPQTTAEMNALPKLTVEQITTSKILSIQVAASTKELCQDFARNLVQVYKKDVDDRLQTRLQLAIKQIKGKVGTSTRDIDKLIGEIARFQQQKNISEAKSEAGLRAAEENSAENAYFNALAAYEGAKAQLAELEAAGASIKKTRKDTFEETNTSQIELEKSNLNKLLQERAALLVKYAPDHDRVRKMDAAIKLQEDVVAKVKKTVVTVRDVPNPEYDQYLVQLRTLRGQVKEAEAKTIQLETLYQSKKANMEALSVDSESLIKMQEKLGQLQKVADQQRQLLTALEVKNNDIESPVTILSSGTLVEQTKPRTVINIILAAVIGLIIGIFVAIARDLSLDRVNYPAEAVNIAGADILSRIPVRSKGKSALIDDPSRARAFESYRLLRAGILMKLEMFGDGAFVVTSANKGEGKTVVAGNLAVAMAIEGRRVIVVDACLRDPKLHKLFRVENEVGLSDVLLDRASVEAACMDTSTPNLKIMTAGTEIENPTEALASIDMQGIIEQLKSRFDIVIFDSPDAYTLADTQELVRHIRNVLFVLELQKSNKSQMQQSLTFLRQAGARVLGMVLNKDPMAKERIS